MIITHTDSWFHTVWYPAKYYLRVQGRNIKQKTVTLRYFKQPEEVYMKYFQYRLLSHLIYPVDVSILGLEAQLGWNEGTLEEGGLL